MAKRISEAELLSALESEVAAYEVEAENAIGAEDEAALERIGKEVTTWRANLAQVFSTPSRQVQSLSRRMASVASRLSLWLDQRPDPPTEEADRIAEAMRQEPQSPTQDLSPPAPSPPTPNQSPADPSLSQAPVQPETAPASAGEPQSQSETDAPVPKPKPSEPPPAPQTKRVVKV